MGLLINSISLPFIQIQWLCIFCCDGGFFAGFDSFLCFPFLGIAELSLVNL